MQDNRKDPTENQKLTLFTEVNGRCPLCGKTLINKKYGRTFKDFEVAHIYPANPTSEEIVLLKNEERLSSDVNDLPNLMAVCCNCHNKFDNPRTIEEYRLWVNLKKKILEENTIKDIFVQYSIEDEIYGILKELTSIVIDEETEILSLNSLKIDEKTNDSCPYILKQKLKDDVTNYFNFIKKCFIELDKATPNKFNTIAAQIKSFYNKCLQLNDNQVIIYSTITDWIKEKTKSDSRQACEIIVAYFVQNCEVFS